LSAHRRVHPGIEPREVVPVLSIAVKAAGAAIGSIARLAPTVTIAGAPRLRSIAAKVTIILAASIAGFELPSLVVPTWPISRDMPDEGGVCRPLDQCRTTRLVRSTRRIAGHDLDGRGLSLGPHSTVYEVLCISDVTRLCIQHLWQHQVFGGVKGCAIFQKKVD
jgi:hypothetical protein